jgi:LuxR family maltose regulon positive regulatory protein
MGPVNESNGRNPGLTDREQRILQMLSATHLSQREIGRELGVSFNTIKSHVKATYIKLGATSREEASQIARNLGLI